MRLRKTTTRGATTASAVILLAAASLITASPSAAAGDERTLTADALATWQTDGIVWTVEYARGVVYVGGTFSSVRPPGAQPGEKEVARKNFAAFDAATGELLPCAQSFSGAGDTVRALKTSRDGTVLYVGGSFNKVGETPVASAVALNTADCSLRRDFRPAMSSFVRAIETTDSAVYLGGDFLYAAGQSRKRLASFSPSGALLPFRADIDAPVRAIMAAPDYGKLIIGGSFNVVNGADHHALIGLNPSTGSTVAAFPSWLPQRSSVKALTRDAANFYVGAEGRGTGIFDGRIAGRLADDEMVWKDTCLGATQAVVAHNGVLYSGSHAHDCSETPGGFPAETERQHFLAQSVSNKHILHWFPDTNGGIGEQNGPRALVMANGILWAGGEFTTVNDRPQQGLTRFAAGPDTGAPEAPPQLKAADAPPGRVTLTWRAAWDRDDAELKYLIYRDGRLVATRTLRSTLWDRPTMTYTEDVVPGSRHRYAIAVTDGENTSPLSRALEVTSPAAKQPDVTAPATGTPEATAPATGTPEATAPVTGTPDMTVPATGTPEATAPATAETGAPTAANERPKEKR
ncbi:fibronectin type III domain-containing protein [Streptomyces sp. NPDC093595]|uniref:fibronectin type III domain-containing protein n=1 Tax=Streptomyces sp. NPDC093595 TaxID=3366045 RepID=UPI003822EDBA